jgi:hypothetical protein
MWRGAGAEGCVRIADENKVRSFNEDIGQVGQESNLQPAVLEPAAVRSATFRDVHEGA